LEAADTTMWAEWRDRRMKGFIAPNGKKVREITGGSVLRELGLYSNMFSIARREWKWVEKSPLTDVGRPDNNAPRTRRVHPWRDVRRIVRGLGYVSGQVPETKSQEVALAFLFALRSAMRAGEILQLGAATLDLQKRVATVNHKMQYKTKLPRRIPLTRHAVRLLAPVAHRELCFTVSSASLDALFRKTRDRLMIEDLHFHDSRAEALTRLARKVDVLTLAKISGHKDVSLLSNTYYRESAEDIAARL
jgi:integrase